MRTGVIVAETVWSVKKRLSPVGGQTHQDDATEDEENSSPRATK
jgi:hypothetical protein